MGKLMRITNVMDASKQDAKQVVQVPANYSKADIKKQVKLDITGLGKDTNFFIDHGRSMQDVKNMAGVLDVQTTQDYMTVMSNTMSKDDYAKMKENGFDPADMTGEESATILDHIKAVMAESGQIIVGYNDSLSTDTLVGVTGNISEASAIARAIKNADISATKDNIADIEKAAEKMSQIESLGENAIAYMIENHMAPTVENIYLANFSSSSNASSAQGYYALDMTGYLGKKSDASGNEMIADIKNAIDRFGIDEIAYEEQVEDALWLIDNDLNVTSENIIALNGLKQITFPISNEEIYNAAAIAIKEGRNAQSANLGKGYEDIYSKAARIYNETNAISDSAVEAVVNEGKEINLKNLSAAQKSIIIDVSNSAATVVTNNTLVSDTKLALEEVRLRMTLDVNVSLLKKGMAIDTMPMSQLVDEMKQQATKTQAMFLGSGSETELSAKASLYKETRQVVNDIPYLPAAVIGRIKIEEQYSLSVVHETGTDLKARYEAAGQSYEALMTAPRKDLGDSIKKAFQNVDDILADLNMEAVEENRKAVRILGYNNMDINREFVNKIQEELSRVMQVVNDLTPAKTLELIRQNINPLDMKLEELSAKLMSMDVEEKDEKYSSFLYKLDRKGDISEKERASYIGIYRLLNRLEKTDAASVGAMVNQDRDITFRSLLSGMRSSKVNMNVAIDENFGFLDKVVQKGVSITDQIEAAFTKEYGDTDSYEYMEDNYHQYMDDLGENSDAADILEHYDIPATINNIVAYNGLVDKDKNVFNRLNQLVADEDSSEELFNSLEQIVDKFEDKASAQSGYEQIWEMTRSYIDDVADYSVDSYIDLKSLSLCNKQIKLAGNLARNEEYVIPMYSEGELTTVKLTLKHEENQKGRIDISYSNESFGENRIHLYMDKDKVKGLIVCDSRNGADRMEKAVNSLEKQGYSCSVNVVIGKENQRSSYDFTTNTDINNVDTKSLYKLAKDFIKAGIKGE